MIYILIGVHIFCCFLFPAYRCAFFNLPFTVYYAVVDMFYFFKHKRWNEADYGDVRTYVAQSSVSFGCGKTLTAVNVAHSLYSRFNNKQVWDSERKKFVTQKIHIISNVAFTDIPYEKLVSLKQFVQEVNEFYKSDLLNDTCTVTYMIVDEAGSQFNSRQFKSNFDALFIKTLLTSRHFKASIVLTSQRQNMIDALMRQITNVVIACKKTWRFQALNYYDGYEIETAQNPALVQPYKRSCWFVRNKNYSYYNTYELVGDLQKSCETGDMLSENEILQLQCNVAADSSSVVKNSRRFKRNHKRIR